jgi:flagellar basal-body rod protein FlgB
MIREVLFGTQGWDQAKGALDAGTLRQRVISSNLANAETPGYKAQDVAFEELLSDQQSRLPMIRTQAGHLGGTTASPASARIQPRPGDDGASGVNNVSVESEMTDLAKNQIHFQALSQFMINRYKAISNSIRSGA